MTADCSKSQLKFLAGLVWYAGGIFLPAKAFSLLMSAQALEPGSIYTWIAPFLGGGIGILKTVLIFDKSCRKNLERIEALSQPKIWEFYRPVFFFFLALMITAGAGMSRGAQGHYTALIAVAVLDLSIGTALLLSGRQFWRNQANSA